MRWLRGLMRGWSTTQAQASAMAASTGTIASVPMSTAVTSESTSATKK